MPAGADSGEPSPRGRRRRALARALLTWVLTAATLVVLSGILSGFHVNSWGAALASALLIGVLNAFVWPAVLRILLPLTVLTLGLGVLVLNGAVVLGVSALDSSGIHVDDLGTGIVVSVAITLVLTLANSLLGIDDDARSRRALNRHAAREAGREGRTRESEVPGLFFLEIDGLAHAVVQRAVRDGNMPTLARWLREGSHRLERWETDWSSQTGACQAGLLHGSNGDMPAFRWWEKDRGAAMVTNHPRDAAEIERRHSDGRGLLHEDGCSRANILSGDAPHSLLTMSTVLEPQRGRLGRDYYAYFANPYSVIRTILLSLAEIASELYYASQQRRRDVRPRIHRGIGYAPVRAWATIVQRDLQVASIIGDLYAGRPVAYTTFLAYDEVAHHSGVERPDALSTLRRVDRELGRIEQAARHAPRPYHLVVLADHGQSQGATFLDRYGHTLEDVVREACSSESVDSAARGGDDALGYLGAGLTEISARDDLLGRTARAATRRRRVGDSVRLEREDREHVRREHDAGQEPPEISVMASGCLGLVSFPREPGRVTLEHLQERYPLLLPALREHDGIGFALVRSRDHGAVAIGPSGVNYLDEDRVEGEDPLAAFGPNAALHVRRTDGFEHCPDIVLNSRYWPITDEVAAFEELVGSHGGMGGEQCFPFVAFPATWRYPSEQVMGSESLHQVMRGWLADLGHDSYRAPAASDARP